MFKQLPTVLHLPCAACKWGACRYSLHSCRIQQLLAMLLLTCADCICHALSAELRVVCNKERKTGKAPPKRLTSHQRQIVERLVAAHGEDVQVGSSGCVALGLMLRWTSNDAAAASAAVTVVSITAVAAVF